MDLQSSTVPSLLGKGKRDEADAEGPHLIPPEAGRGTTHSPRFSKSLITIGFLANAEHRYTKDVVVIKFGFAMEHRLLSFGEKEG